MDSIKGVEVVGQIVGIQYVQGSGQWYSLEMTLPNAHYLLVLLSHLPGAKEVLAKAKAFDRHHGGR